MLRPVEYDWGVRSQVEAAVLSEVAASVRRGEPPSDERFDELLPEGARNLAGMFWTPVAVAMKASAWLDELGVATVLDVGSGVGKFCALAALAGKAHFTGVEHRARLVPLATELARALGVGERARFFQGTLGETPLPAVDAYYFYNPFGENVYGPEDHLDEDVLLTPSRYSKDVSAALALLEAAPVGTVLVTYNGLGAHAPPSYRPLRTESIGASELSLLRREQSRRLYLVGSSAEP